VWVASVLTLAVLLLAVTAGLVASPTGGAPVIIVERVSSAISELASGAGSRVWWTYAFVLGLVAAFNPCGFALLPAYVGLYLYEEQANVSLPGRTKRALIVSLVVAGSFAVLFGAIGTVFSFGSSFIVRSLPWVGLGAGILLILAGGAFMAGSSVTANLPDRLAERLGPVASGPGIRGYAAFGLAYGLVSLGCALPLFLALLGTSVAAGGRWTVPVAFVLYGAGMAAVLGSLTLLASIVGLGILGRVRRLGRFVSGFGAGLLLVSGAYVVYYWLTAGRLLLG
jgi:cytochrome c biogenesis protein CcdA